MAFAHECQLHFLLEKHSKPYLKYGAVSIAEEKCGWCHER